MGNEMDMIEWSREVEDVLSRIPNEADQRLSARCAELQRELGLRVKKRRSHLPDFVSRRAWWATEARRAASHVDLVALGESKAVREVGYPDQVRYNHRTTYYDVKVLVSDYYGLEEEDWIALWGTDCGDPYCADRIERIVSGKAWYVHVGDEKTVVFADTRSKARMAIAKNLVGARSMKEVLPLCSRVLRASEFDNHPCGRKGFGFEPQFLD